MLHSMFWGGRRGRVEVLKVSVMLNSRGGTGCPGWLRAQGTVRPGVQALAGVKVRHTPSERPRAAVSRG